jgi:hypothetical protein
MMNTTARDPSIARDTIRASAGENVWVLLTHIKADKREAFEHFMQNILIPAAQQAAPEVYRHVRFLRPTEPNEDGTYTYIFLPDPLLPDGEYGIVELLKQVYPAEQVTEYLQVWDDSLASPQVGYEVVQTSW